MGSGFDFPFASLFFFFLFSPPFPSTFFPFFFFSFSFRLGKGGATDGVFCVRFSLLCFTHPLSHTGGRFREWAFRYDTIHLFMCEIYIEMSGEMSWVSPLLLLSSLYYPPPPTLNQPSFIFEPLFLLSTPAFLGLHLHGERWHGKMEWKRRKGREVDRIVWEGMRGWMDGWTDGTDGPTVSDANPGNCLLFGEWDSLYQIFVYTDKSNILFLACRLDHATCFAWCEVFAKNTKSHPRL